MATLESALNPQYSENASKLTGNPNRVDVEVEDTIDEAFWANLLSELCPHKDFHFDPYHTILNEDGSTELKGKGKAEIMKASIGFNAYRIGCVDSDYDWLLSDYTDDGKVINSSKFLLQTYAYSIENLMCQSNTLNSFCSENTEEPVEFDFEDYLSRLSKAVFPLLVWSAYLYSKGNMSFTPTAWHDVLVNTERNAETSLDIIEGKAKKEIERLEEDFTEEMAERDKFQKSLTQEKGLTENDAYLYIKGHDLFDHLVYSVISPEVTALRNRHFQTLRNTDTDEQSRKAALKEYSEKNKSVKVLLQKNYRYKEVSPIYEKIKNEVLQIW